MSARVLGVSGSTVGHLLTPLSAGGTSFQRDVRLSWGDDGLLRAPESGDGGDLLLVPGLIDAHVHLPQHRVRGRFQEALLPWLREYIWPEEMRFAEREYREGVTREFREGLIAAGTTSAMVYGSPLSDSAYAVLEDVGSLCIKGGDVLMDRNGPPETLRYVAAADADCAAHIATFGERYALTPRFVPTCSGPLMQACGEHLAGGVARLQTHLSENLDEVAWVRELHPEHASYTAVYAAFGLLGPRSIFGHCIHLSDDELSMLAASGSWVAHCPSSNVALGSGRMPLERIRAAGIPVALATDVGAGPELSMLHVMATFLEVHRGITPVSPTDALRLATLQGACAMGEPLRGSLQEGRHADVVALRIPGGLRRSDDADSVLQRILAEHEDRWEEAVAAVFASGRQLT